MIELFFPITIGACVIGVVVYLVVDKNHIKKQRIKNDPNTYENQLKSCEEEREKFKWLKTPNGTEYFIYPFHKNKLTLLVFKYDNNTAGMSWHIINKLNKKPFKFSPAKLCDRYNYQGGISITKESTEALHKWLKNYPKCYS